MEKKLVKTIFPDGHSTSDLTRPEDGDQKIIFHYIPFTDVYAASYPDERSLGTNTWSISPKSAQEIQGPVDSAG